MMLHSSRSAIERYAVYSMPITARPSLMSRTVPMNNTVAPFPRAATRARSLAGSIGASTIAEYTSSSRNRWNERDLIPMSEQLIA